MTDAQSAVYVVRDLVWPMLYQEVDLAIADLKRCSKANWDPFSNKGKAAQLHKEYLPWCRPFSEQIGAAGIGLCEPMGALAWHSSTELSSSQYDLACCYNVFFKQPQVRVH